MDKNKIESIASISKAEKWAFPKTFKLLKDAGVSSYEVMTSKHQIIYYDGKQTYQEPPPKEFSSLEIAADFSLEDLKKALKNVQTGQTNYEEFLKEIAQAGIHHYRVDMASHTVTYYGAKSGEEYAEVVPHFRSVES
jgi:uncharacterized protein YbcV (DUF1398 family)